MVVDKLNEAAVELTSAVGPTKDWFSDHSKKKKLQIVRVLFAQGPCCSKKLDMFVTFLVPEPRKISLYRPKRKTRTRQSFLYHSKLDYSSRFARVIHAVQVSFKFCLSPCAGARTHLDIKSDCISRFVHGRRASILVLVSIRNRQAECHLEFHIIPADDSHTLPLFEESLQSLQPQGGLRLNLAHRHQSRPSSPASSTKASKTVSNSGVYGASDSLFSPSDASCPRSTVAVELSFEAATSVCIVSRGPQVLFGDASSSHPASYSSTRH